MAVERRSAQRLNRHDAWVEEVRIGSPNQSQVVLRNVGLDDDGFGSFVVELHAAGLDVASGVMTHDGSGGSLDAYFRDLADSWRGWSGVKRWDSVENDLSVGAERMAGANHLRFTARHGHPPVWVASLDVRVEPGEEATGVAADVSRLFDAARRS